MGSKKLLIISILFILIASGTVTSFTYAFFTINLETNNLLNIDAIFSDSDTPAFIAYTDEDIVMNIMADQVPESKSIVGTSSVNMTSELTGGSSEKNVSVTCLYDIYFDASSKGYDHYVPSSGVIENNLMEYTLKITENSNTILEETPINKLKNGSHIILDESITSKGNTTKKIYQVTSTIYNLDINQSIFGKKYKIIVKIDNPRCAGDTNE